MTIGALTVFLSYLNKFFKPVQDLAKMTNVIAQAAVGMERIQAILDADTIIPQKPDARDPGKLKGEIVFEHVAFAYDPAAPVLRDINLTIKPGQRVGVCGPTGGGKSTVLSLIPRFYDPTAGRVLIDGVDVTDYKLDAACARRSGLSCRTPSFSPARFATISPTGGSTRRRRRSSKRRRWPMRTISSSQMPHGYDSMVGERGLTLSGGQRQRIGIARAVVRNSPILILDEPTAALDTESEKVVMEALERLMKGRTVITIAHRLSTIRDARQDRRAQRRRGRRGRHARRTHPAQPNLRRALPHPGGRHARSRSTRRPLRCRQGRRPEAEDQSITQNHRSQSTKLYVRPLPDRSPR